MIESTGRVAVFNSADEPIEIRRLALPKLQSGEALVRVLCCTICGSDLHTYEGRRASPVPTVLGHEVIGEVCDLGSGDGMRDIFGDKLRSGDRITWSVAASCGVCFFCRHELPQKCERLFKYGHEIVTEHDGFSGGLADYCRLVTGTQALRVPPAISDAVAAPLNCATATVAGALRVGDLAAGQSVLIQGVGMLGLTACAMASWMGASTIIASDIDPERVALASAFGATECVVGSGDELTEAILCSTSGRGVDLGIELSGTPEAAEMGLELVRTGGSYVLVGSVAPSRRLELDPELIVRRMLTIRGLHNYAPADLAMALRFMVDEHEKRPFANLTRKTFSLGEASAALEYAVSERPYRVAVRP